jgi:hypothetical protein
MYVSTCLAARYSPIRRAVYRVLLEAPRSRWSVADMVAALPPGPKSAETVRATLYVLADVGILGTEHEGHRLLFLLAESGAARLKSILASWPQ